MSEELVTFFKALADANRLKIVGLLAQQPYSVEQLAAILDLRPSTISHHLKELQLAGLIVCEKEGQALVCSINEELVEEIKHYFD